MSNSKFVPLAIIAIVSATAVSQARAEDPLGHRSKLVYYYESRHPELDTYTGQSTPASKLGISALVAASRAAAGLDNASAFVPDASVAAAAQPHRSHFAERAGGKTSSRALNALALVPASAHRLGHRS